MRIGIVTGASSGLGREFARQIAAERHLDQLWVIARRMDRLERLKQEIEEAYQNIKVCPIALDLTCREEIDRLSDMLKQTHPEVDVLVNASGFGKYGTYKDLTTEEITKMIDLNCKSVVLMTYSVLPFMKEGSRILTMGSASAFQPLPEFNMYASTKSFVVHFSRALNVELKSRRITATCVCPGYVRTEFFDVARDTSNPNTCQNFTPMYEPVDVVKKALTDNRKGKDLSVLGMNTKMKRMSGKLLPAKLVMSIWMKIK